jgi:hypothetical protein
MNALNALARKHPTTMVRLHFAAGYDPASPSVIGEQRGTIEVTALKAVRPNRSGRFFPPDGVTWPVPWFYGSECYKVEYL